MRRVISITLIFIVLALPVAAKEIEKSPKIALVLSGGIVTRGLSEIGVIKALEEENIPIDYVAGTSMGAVLGSLLAQGYSADEIEMIAKSIDWRAAFAQMYDYENLLFGEKEKFGKYLLSLELDGFKPVIPRGLVSSQKPALLFTEISLKGLSIREFNDFKIPFRANAVDIETGEEVVFSSGYLPKVLRASSAVPVMMEPVEIEGRLLVDGGAINNLPVNLVAEFEPDVIIAVNLGMGLKAKEEINSFLSVLSQSLALPQKETVGRHRLLADVLIEPDISAYSFTDFEKIDEIIEVGYKSAKAKIPEIRKLVAEMGKTLPAVGPQAGKRKVSIKKISFLGNTIYPEADLRRLIASAQAENYNENTAKLDKRLIWRKYFLDGYKLAEIDYLFDAQSGELIFRINEGQIEMVQVTGREHISDVFLKDKIRALNVFNAQNVASNVDRLYSTGYFESVDFSVIPGKKGWALEYNLKEKQRNSLAVGLRYDTYQQLSLLTDLTIKYFKSQNFNQTLSLKIGNEFNAQLISEFWPKHFAHNLQGEVTLFYEKRAQDLYQGSQVVSSFYYLPKGLRIAGKANLDPFGQISSGVIFSNVNYENIFSFFPDENVAKTFIRTEIDTLDDPISPKSGFAARAEYQQAGLMLGGQFDFSKALADLSIYTSLPNRHVVFTKGHLQLGRGDVPLSESYRLGGADNLMGFGRGRYVGKHAAALRLGYRIPLYFSETNFIESVYCSLIQDFGMSAVKIDDLSTDKMVSGYGCELQVGTVLGLSSRLSLGFGQQTFLYFAIGNQF
jgi:predicted acylesterase/phospholipase RssA